MITITYTPTFVRMYAKLVPELQDEVYEKIELLKHRKHHKVLKVHKLQGALKGRMSFSVNYKTRIIFHFTHKDEVVLLAVGDHSIYG